MKRLKKESGWSPRVIQPLKDYYLIGSFTAKEDAQVFPALRDADEFSLQPLMLTGKRFTWAVQHQAENWLSLQRSTAGPS